MNKNGKLARVEKTVYNVIRTSASGLTTDAVTRITHHRHQSVSARVYDLRKSGLIRDSGQRRFTTSGRKAIVWVSIAN